MQRQKAKRDISSPVERVFIAFSAKERLILCYNNHPSSINERLKLYLLTKENDGKGSIIKRLPGDYRVVFP
jgi:hypothetical protein